MAKKKHRKKLKNPDFQIRNDLMDNKEVLKTERSLILVALQTSA